MPQKTLNKSISNSLVVEEGERHRPFLRWAGSKKKQLPRLAKFWQSTHKRYVEPFAGSACLFFRLAPKAAILGDNNSSLIQFYRIVRDDPYSIYNRFSRIPRDSETYYRWRKKNPLSLDSESRAVRFLYLNRNCFNGIYRTNSSGHFNVPIGADTGEYPTWEEFQKTALLLGRAKFVSGDFTNTLRYVKSGDFVYLDPPFALQSRRLFNHYGTRTFQTEDVPRLDDALMKISNIGASFLVSYADCTEARSLAKNWASIRLPIARHIGGNNLRRNAYEWLITNMKIPCLD